MKQTSVSRLVMTPVLAALFILVTLNAASIFKSFTLLSHFDQLENTLVQAERDVNLALATFKTQVQEWKNVLLRGGQAKDREKYWVRFQQREAQITKIFAQLAQNPHISRQAVEDIHRFTQAHQLMADKYREGYAAFVAAGYDPAVGDSYVRGIDREPAALLASVADEIAGQSQTAFVTLRTSTEQTLWWILSSAVVLTVLCLFYVIRRLRHQVISPVKDIAQCLSALARSNYDFPLQYRSQHELGILADSARALQTKLHSTITLLQQAESQMNHAVGTLGEVSTTIEQGADKQRIASDSLEASTQRLKDIVHNLVSVTEQVAVATQHSETHIARCYQTFEQANEGFHKLAKTVNRSSEVVGALKNRSTTILSVVNVINEIADQTNLLALNAAIEAARAGDHGRGFAVVADEVRALAAKTQQSTREINQILSSFEAEALEAVTAMDQGKALSDSNAIEASRALETLNQVVVNIHQTAGVVQALNEAADEQDAVLKNVEIVIEQVVDSSQRYMALSQRKDISQSMTTMAGDVEQVVLALTR